jgi:hypothetical protein
VGTPDTINVLERYGQVKCFEDQCKLYTVGDEVPDHFPVSSYSIAMREGGYVNVDDCKIVSWTDEPEYPNIFDKYGQIFEPESTVGLFGEPYFFGEDD